MDMDKKLLIVDDFSTMRKIAKRMLESMGFTSIMEAEDGREALDILGNDKIDLILSDCNMPNMNGVELLKNIRNDPGTESIPFIVMTSKDQKESLLEMVKAGASDYIDKPFQANDLRQKLEKFIG